MKTVLVTGGRRRIGAAISEALRELGFNVVVTSRTGLGSSIKVDFSRRGAVDCVADHFPGGVWGLVNNAAEFPLDGRCTAAQAKRIRRVNFDVPRELVLRLKPRSVVNIIDAAVLRSGFAPGNPYEQSKADLLEETLREAVELAPETRVNAVAPGPVLAPEVNPSHIKGERTLLGKRPTPADVAAAVAFLLASPSLTGQVIAVDSGQSLIPCQCGEEIT